MKHKHLWKKVSAYVIAAAMIFTAVPVYAGTEDSELAGLDSEIAELTSENAAWITYTDYGAAITGADGASASGTTVTISQAGNYVFDGSCSNGNIVVAKGSGEVNVYLNGLTLTEPDEGECPIATKGSALKGTAADVTITAVKGTTNTLTDADHGETSPKAAINASGDITLTGTGNLAVYGNNKNGIKSDADIMIDAGVYVNVTALDNGISADGQVEMTGGNIKIKTTNGDALRSCPDVFYDADGNQLVDTTTTEATADDLANAVNGCITISGGCLMASAGSDAIQADNDLTISGGTYSLTANGGYQTKIASNDTGSYKGLKAADELSVSGGTFYINTADDAIHSNAYAYLTGGSFEILTGDDAAHADTTLVVGEEGAADDALRILIDSAYEGLEAGTIYVYSGTVKAKTSDDGMNAAGGSSETGTDTFNPGGGFGPGRQGNPSQNTGSSTAAADYTLNINGGNIYLNTEGDGIDSNGSIYMTGGQLIVFGSSDGGNAAIDYGDSNGCVCEISGGTLFAAGQLFSGKAVTPTGGTQSYKSWTQTYASGSIISISNGSKVVFSITAPKKVANVIYSDSGMTSTGSYTCASASVSSADPGEAFADMEVTLPAWFDDNYSSFTENEDDSSETGTGDEGTDTGSGDESTDTDSGDEGTDTGSGDESTDTDSGDEGTDTGSSPESTTSSKDKAGTRFTSKGLTYKVTKVSGSKGYVKVVKASVKKTKLTVPSTIKHNGVTYKVTTIGAKAFYKHTRLKSVVIGKYVSRIGSKAFYGCSKLTRLTIKTTRLTKKRVGSRAFYKLSKKIKIKVPKSKLKAYRKISGLKKAVKL